MMKAAVVLFLICSNVLVSAAPIKVTARLKTANQLELTVAPVPAEPESFVEVLARTNTPGARWFSIYACLGNSNRTVTGVVDLKEKGLTTNSVPQLVFAAAPGDYDGNEIPDVYDELVFRGNPYLESGAIDPYAEPMGDGWSNLQKYNSGLPPYEYCRPHDPEMRSVQYYTDTNSPGTGRRGHAVISWVQKGPVEYFRVERAECTLRRMTNPPPYGMPRPRPRPESPFIYGPFHFFAQVPYRTGVSEYKFVDTNVDTFLMPKYRLQTHYLPPPSRAYLESINTTTILQTAIAVTATATTNGFDLTVRQPIPNARYLLLVRDKTNRQWRASGYFESGTNRSPVHLRTDRKGMMSQGQSPLAMPTAHFFPDAADPEFIAGWGEDSDGDALPDIYEVLVTKTDPANADTGATGIIDGFKDFPGDGWNNVMKFHLRADPFAPVYAPAPVELKQPTLAELMTVVMKKTAFPFEPKIEIRLAGATEYQPADKPMDLYTHFYSKEATARYARDRRGDCDLRIHWVVPEYKTRMGGGP